MRTLIVAVVVLAACAQPPAEPAPISVDPSCKRDQGEPDADESPWFGPGVVDGMLAPPAQGSEYLISTTYLRLKPDAETKHLFREGNGPVLEALPTIDGLVAYRFSSSEHCFTARTLTVWRDVASMQRFAAGDAHRNAMVLVGDLSRGGSQVTHWTGTQADATWDAARSHLATATGNTY